MTTVQQIEGAVRLSEEFGRKIATAEEAREIMKIGVWYNSVEETLKNLGLPPNRGGRRTGLHGLGDRRQEERPASDRPIRIRWPTAWSHPRR